ncbi:MULTISPECIES: hypothetical protein [unclassified Pseudomonas]|uniref:hypothetical protein n=1 Tax=unclassified Pseudomonas TaxID=196821 RepID=UPI0009EA220D|nr:MULTISPECIES: hypothetical protein [unclassified Pseudomonas]AUF95483.1 hypothetical protein CXQ80_06375 [Pseudomonas sp. 02C 26]
MSNRVDWENRGKTVAELIAELKTFGDQHLKVEISFDEGETSRPISIVVKRDGKCLLLHVDSLGD